MRLVFCPVLFPPPSPFLPIGFGLALDRFRFGFGSVRFDIQTPPRSGVVVGRGVEIDLLLKFPHPAPRARRERKDGGDI